MKETFVYILIAFLAICLPIAWWQGEAKGAKKALEARDMEIVKLIATRIVVNKAVGPFIASKRDDNTLCLEYNFIQPEAHEVKPKEVKSGR